MPAPQLRAPSIPTTTTVEPSVARTLMPLVTAIFVVYLVIGVALPVLPMHVHQGLGFGPLMVGLVSGAQFTASLLSRFWAGNYADRHGGKRAITVGLVVAAVSGLFYLLSLSLTGTPISSLLVLLSGRAILGGAESFIVTGALTWGFGLVGARHAGRVMAWVGTAMYVAFAVGAPLGSAVYGLFGFAAIAVVTSLIPLATLFLIARAPSTALTAHAPRSIKQVVRAVWMPGLGLALGCVGFGAITTFIVLLYAQHGWANAWLAFTVLSVAFAGARLVLGHLPDKIGGARCALYSVLIEATGQALIWLASSPALALFGAALTGVGYALVYPGFGVEAVRHAPPESRGLATGTYTAFLDLALGIAGPTLGLVASGYGLNAVFFVSTIVVLGAAVVALQLRRRDTRR